MPTFAAFVAALPRVLITVSLSSLGLTSLGLTSLGPAPVAVAAAGHPARTGPVPPRPSSVVVGGHGLGHGRGMGQWGAYGYASEPQYRWTYRQILQHYYSSASLEPIGAAADGAVIPVNLSELDGAPATEVRPAVAGARVEVNGHLKRLGTINVHHSGKVQVIRATAGDLSVNLPGVGWRTYDGTMVVQPATAPDGTGGQTWNVVSLEQYVAGVVPAESPAGWGATGGEAALQAQAVAVRSYALAYVAAAGRICDTESCQVYGGNPASAGLGSAAAYSDWATSSTAGVVECTVAVAPCPAAAIASTEYSSSTGGYTAGGTFPAVVDAGDAVAGNAFHNWTEKVSLAEIQGLYPAVGRIRAIHVVMRNGLGANGGRSLEVRITGKTAVVMVSGVTFSAQLGLPSDWFYFSTQP